MAADAAVAAPAPPEVPTKSGYAPAAVLEQNRTEQPLLARNPSVLRHDILRQVVRALDPEVCLDFPQLTDICDAMAANPATADMAASVLVATLTEEALKPGDIRNVTRDYLKVLTMINEMVFDAQVAQVVRQTEGLRLALDRLKQFKEGDMGVTTNDNIRMLACEIEKRVFEDRTEPLQAPPEERGVCRFGHPLEFKNGIGIFHVHARTCGVCRKDLRRTTARYNCATCYYYDVCTDCIQTRVTGALVSRNAPWKKP
eukprot:TRINITY_DN64759_c0_g1_i1.p1 TRINITY_DN64759_c0_g1~~TRINITY_DN64759_c0_g1_i1.p1  ORF type:complete len:270 (+),score=28.18 TRINITY_DN64759_c0_g1_i1:40-810(+)